ncbi:helix-turn-helix domain-containing protein [Flavobacterium sp. Root901]|uniref:helix-turn-helix domain-containing protein n=1 Tax=Flavobacterium sp. Root901 TaxID=1736605 RepID=UPI0009EC6438|nr:helix-turn-helix transcriptional regulator [Flavobacterium sp. Root901]
MEKNKYELEIIKLGLLIKELRGKQNITQLQLSTLCNVDVRTIQRIEKGKQNITIGLLFSIAYSLKIESSVLISKIFSENNLLQDSNEIYKVEDLKRLGTRIKELRTAKGLSQAKLGLLIFKDEQFIHKVEAGEFNPTYLNLLALSKGLGISIKELFDFE